MKTTSHLARRKGGARPLVRLTALTIAAAAAGSASAQTQVVSPPRAQAWIDVATFSGFGMPAGGANPMAALGGLFGGSGGGAKNSFGQTQSASPGRWVDVTLMVRANPGLAEAQQSVPAGFMSPALKLQSPRDARPVPGDEPDDKVIERDVERPRGKLLMYWGCGATVRSGQPKVLDMASASAADLGRFFVSRSSTGRGAHASPGRPLWPSPTDSRMVPAGASLVGVHAFSGDQVPASFRFQIPAAQDLMPALALRQRDAGGATDLAWDGAPTARAYFVAGMGSRSQDEMVIWTSSELPETGFALSDYQTNAAVDRWLREKVLLAPQTRNCTVPKGVFSGEGAMLKLVAYGSELNLAYPPRPTDPRQRWDPEWAVKVRVKSVASAMLGMEDMPQAPATERPAAEAPERKEQPEEAQRPKPLDILRGILGR